MFNKKVNQDRENVGGATLQVNWRCLVALNVIFENNCNK